ncbi:MAG: alpha/beta fold hydrolase [Solirubrobacteraceae bacterium]
MERSARYPVARLSTLAAAVSLAAAATLFAGSAGAQIAFRPCPHTLQLACGHLNVPLNPSQPSGPSIRLTIRRHRAPLGPAKSAVVALAGGPGQAAVPFTQTFEEVLGPILASRDLIVYDQRGTGSSHPLRCHAIEHAGASGESAGRVVRRCAEQIGSQRSFFSSLDSVADIEAIRIAGGYEKLVLYGTSYGTKVALEYAQQHPSHVEALILDSVVLPNGPGALALSTFAAVPRILRQLCAHRRCSHITSKPVRDLERLVAKIGGRGLSTRVIGPSGQAQEVRVSSQELLGVLIDGDLNPILRAEFPGAVRSALLGDTASLGRLVARTQSGSESGSEGIDLPLYYATSCEEQLFPWSRQSSPHRRLAEAEWRIAALPRSAFAPFARSDVLAPSDIRECASWPYSSPAPTLNDEPLPSVPTVILSGADDLRTPTSGARALAARIPGAHVVVVPNTGHSVLTTEPGGCALHAVRALFAKRTIRSCRRERPKAFMLPTPLAPRRLASLSPTRPYGGLPGRTLDAVGLTLADALRELVLGILEGRVSGTGRALQVGGLRSGWVRLASGGLTLRDYSYVPGVTVSGDLTAHAATLTVGGSAAAHGTLHTTRAHALVGSLGGTHVDLRSQQLGAALASAASVRHGGDLARRLGVARASAYAGADTALATLDAPLANSLRAALRYAASR